MDGTLVADVKEMLTEQVEYKELLYQITLRDLKLRYKQTVMGFGWAVFMPLLNTALFSVIFTRVAPIETPVAYPVWVYCGFAVWNFFSAGVRFATNSLSSNMNLVTKVYFPREILPVSAVLVSAVDFLVSTSVLAALMIWYRIVPGTALLLAPFLILLQMMFAAAVSLVLAMANVFFRDVKYLVEALMTLWMFATAVVYPVDKIGGRLGLLMRLNPMTPLIEAFRSVILYNRMPDTLGVVYVTVASAACLAAAWLMFHRAEFKFAESV